MRLILFFVVSIFCMNVILMASVYIVSSIPESAPLSTELLVSGGVITVATSGIFLCVWLANKYILGE